VYSPAGGHLCFATDVLGPNMMALWSTKPNQIFSVSITKHIIKQILYSVDYLHCECGYIHTGNPFRSGSFSLTLSAKKACLDIKADNVLTVLPEPIIPKIDKHLEEHQPATYDNIKSSVKSQPLSDFNLDLHQLTVKLIDYSEGEM
jgi:serine/threonine-protein kinase SRPK3